MFPISRGAAQQAATPVTCGGRPLPDGEIAAERLAPLLDQGRAVATQVGGGLQGGEGGSAPEALPQGRVETLGVEPIFLTEILPRHRAFPVLGIVGRH
jgi:hypothetical protein